MGIIRQSINHWSNWLEMHMELLANTLWAQLDLLTHKHINFNEIPKVDRCVCKQLDEQSCAWLNSVWIFLTKPKEKKDKTKNQKRKGILIIRLMYAFCRTHTTLCYDNKNSILGSAARAAAKENRPKYTQTHPKQLGNTFRCRYVWHKRIHTLTQRTTTLSQCRLLHSLSHALANCRHHWRPQKIPSRGSGSQWPKSQSNCSRWTYRYLEENSKSSTSL